MEHISRSSIFPSQEEEKILKIFKRNKVTLRIHNGCLKFLGSFLPAEKLETITGNPPTYMVYTGKPGGMIADTKKSIQESKLVMLHWLQAVEYAEKHPLILRDMDFYCPINNKTGLVIYWNKKNSKIEAMVMDEPRIFFPRMKIPCHTQ